MEFVWDEVYNHNNLNVHAEEALELVASHWPLEARSKKTCKKVNLPAGTRQRSIFPFPPSVPINYFKHKTLFLPHFERRVDRMQVIGSHPGIPWLTPMTAGQWLCVHSPPHK